MNLLQCLESQPPAHLRETARLVGLPLGAAPAEDLAGAVAALLKDPRLLGQVVQGLDEAERAALKVITFAGGGSGIVMEQCHQRINQVTGRRRRNGAQVVGTLMGHGLVFVGRARYRQYYFVPLDLQSELAALFGRALLGQVALPQGTPVHPAQDDSYAPLRWTCQFLAVARKVRIQLTQAGTIFRRTQRYLLGLLGDESAAPAGPRDRGPAPDAAPDEAPQAVHLEPVGFIFGYSRSRGLCEARETTLDVTPAAAEWMARPTWERRRDMLAYWRESRASWDVDVQAVLSVLLSLPGETWIDLRALFDELEPMATDLFRGSLQRRLEQKVIRYLTMLGVLRLGWAEAGPACRLTAIGRALLAGGPPVDDPEPERSFFVQPDFELLVPSRIETELLWRIEECADLEQPDRMMVYRLTRDTVYRALRLGRRAAEIVDLLERHCPKVLPQNVVFSVRDWSAEFGRIWFASAFTLNCDSLALADELQASRTIGTYIRGRLSPTSLIVDRESYPQLVTTLLAEGYMPAPGVRLLGESLEGTGFSLDDRPDPAAAEPGAADSPARSRPRSDR